MSYIDIGIIAVVALCALIGLWKGFFKTVISFFGWFVSFLISFFLTRPIADALLDIGGIRSFVVDTEGWSLYTWILGKLPDLNGGGVLATVLSPIIRVAEAAGGNLNENVALLLANGVFSVLVCIALLIVLRLVLLLFTMFANAMTKDKFVGALNRLLGLVAGAVKGTGIVAIIMVFFTFIMGLSFMAPVRTQIDNSVIAAPLYKQISKLTDKFLAGDNDTLTKLLNFAGLDRDGPSEPDPVAGTYVFDDGGVTRSELELRADGTFQLRTATGESSDATAREGTYARSDDKLTLTFSKDGEATGETSELLIGDGWLWWGEGYEEYFVRDGVTPPAAPPETDPAPPASEPEGGEQTEPIPQE